MRSYEDRVVSYDWYWKQIVWHTTQLRTCSEGRVRWHLSQIHWYKGQRKRLFTFSEIVQRAMMKHSPQIAETVKKNNALFQRLENGKAL